MAFALLYEPGDPYTTTLVESILTENGIECRIVERGLSPTLFGRIAATETVEVLVEEERLDEAKQLLCEHDIVCDLSERLRQRGFESLAMPLLRGETQDLGRLTNYLRVNNKTTVAAILDDIAQHRQGPKLLMRLFFELLGGEEHPTLLRLARFLNEHPPEALRGAIESLRLGLAPEKRRDLAEMLGTLASIAPEPLLVGMLIDEDVSVREAAIEALFALTSEDFGFEPDAPEEERVHAVRKWEAAMEGRGPAERAR